MTEDFILECKNPAYANRLGKIEYGDNEVISSSDYLSKIEFEDTCVTNGVIVGSANAKSINFETLSNYELREQEIDAQIGVKYGNDSEEYIGIGKYIIQDENAQETAKNGQYKGLDKLSLLDKPYVCNIEDLENSTIKDFLIDVCQQSGIVLKTLSFTNDDLPVGGNPFTNNETCRTVLNAILKCSLNFASIDNDDNSLELKWLDDEVSETFSKDDYNNLEKNNVYGPINSLIIRDPVINGENVVREDPESIELNGEHQFIIEDTYFLRTEALRSLAIDNIWNKVNGLTYVNCKLTTNLGKPYLKAGNKISIQGDDDTYFNTYVLKHQFTYDGTFNSVIEAPSLTVEQEQNKNHTDYKTRFRNTERSVDKINGEIKDIIEETLDPNNPNSISVRLSESIRDIESLKNIFQITGGSNMIKNSQFLLPDKTWLFENNGSDPYHTELGRGYDAGLTGTTVSYGKIELRNIILSSSITSDAEGHIPNINDLIDGQTYTLNFLFSQDASTTTKFSLKTGENIIWESDTFTGEKTTQEVAFTFDATSSIYVFKVETSTTSSDEEQGHLFIYDLMLNSGDKKPWEPAQSEIASTVLQMSKEGLTVKSTGAETTTLLNTDGINIYEGETISERTKITSFNKTGLVTRVAKTTETDIGRYVMKAITINNTQHHVEYFRGND